MLIKFNNIIKINYQQLIICVSGNYIKLCHIELLHGLMISHATEIAMQNVAMFLRSVPNWEIVEPLPDIGK